MFDLLKFNRFKSPEALRNKITRIRRAIEQLDAEIEQAQAIIKEIDTPVYHPDRKKEYNQAKNTVKKLVAQKNAYNAEIQELNILIQRKEERQAGQLKVPEAKKWT